MAKYGSPSVVVMFDNSGGTPVDMTQHVRAINGITIEAITQESHSFGDSWFEHLATGLKKMEPIELSGFYDDTASTGPNVIFIDIGNTTTRTITITYGSTKTTAVETIIQKYSRMPKVGELHGYSVTLLPTGTVTEA